MFLHLGGSASPLHVSAEREEGYDSGLISRMPDGDSPLDNDNNVIYTGQLGNYTKYFYNESIYFDGMLSLYIIDLLGSSDAELSVSARYLSYGATAQLTNLLVSNAGGNGVESVSASVDIVGTSITDSVGVGFLASGDFDGDGYTIQGGDCDDTTSLVNPGRTEVVGDQLDNDCDGVVDDGTDTADNDGDGVSIADGDCNDRLYSGEDVYPGATENPQNGMDDDCDGVVDDGIGPAIRLSGLSISGSGASGVQLSDLAATSTDSAFTGNGGWGMECDNVTFTTCDTTTLTGNTSGGHTGCDETCGL